MDTAMLDFAAGMTATTTTVATISLLAISYTIYQRHFSPLANIPGPFLASLTSLWLAHAYRRGDWHHYSIRLHKTYGPIVRVAPGAVDVGGDDPAATAATIKTIYGAGTKFFKGQWYRHLLAGDPSRKNVIGVTDRAEHRRMRKNIDPLYTLRALRESEGRFDGPVASFLAQMRSRGKKGEVVNMAEWTIALAIDGFTAMTYGESYGLLERGGGDEGMSRFAESSWELYTPCIMLAPWVGYMAKRYKAYQGMIMGWFSGGGPPLPILPWTGKKIQQGLDAREQHGPAPTLLERGLKLHQESPESFPRDILMAHMFEIVFAGFETCGSTLAKIIYRIAATEGCQERVRTELEAIVKAQAKDSSVVAGLVAFDELVKLPYLNACINEGYRIDPITGIALSRTVPSGGARLNGFDIPEGTEIGITPWVTSYNEAILPQPDKFRPERWLQATKEERVLMERSDLFFGGGPSSCPGKVLATGFIYKVIAVVFANFRVECVDPREDKGEINIFPVKWRKARVRLTPITRT